MKYRYLIFTILLPLLLQAKPVTHSEKQNTCARLLNMTMLHYTLSRELPVPFMEFKNNDTTALALQGFEKRLQRKPGKQSFTTYFYKYEEIRPRYAQAAIPKDLRARLDVSHTKQDEHIFIDYSYVPIEDDPGAAQLKYKLREDKDHTCDLVHISESNGRIIYHDGFCRALLPEITSYSTQKNKLESAAYDKLKSFQDEVGKEYYFFLKKAPSWPKLTDLPAVEKTKFQNLLVNCKTAMTKLNETSISFPLQQVDDHSQDINLLIKHTQPVQTLPVKTK